MQDNPLISVIVPVYKVEPYLKQCLDSIVNQTYTNLEIILVDDGSPDKSPAICDEYASRDSRIAVIHKENGGLSEARNAGLDICKGEYISFVDSDDWIETNCIEILFDFAQKEHADLVIASHKETMLDSTTFLQQDENIPNTFSKASSHELLLQLCQRDCPNLNSAWGKLFKKELFTSIRFPKGKLYEDMYVNYRLYFLCKNVYYTHQQLYNYRLRSGSITRSNINPVPMIEALEERHFFLKEHGEIEASNAHLKKLCWDFLFVYGTKTSYFHNNTHTPNRTIAKKKFKTLTDDYFKYTKATTLSDYFLLIFSKLPEVYLMYRKISPFKIRK